MKYLKNTGQNRVDVEEKARKFLREGYARLASFEVPGGGFSYYGNSPALLWLSAFGLRQLDEMKPFVAVDPELLKRTERYVQEHLQECKGAERLFLELVLYERGTDPVKRPLEPLASGLPPERSNIYEEAIQLNLLSLKYPKNPEVKTRVEILASQILILKGQIPAFRTLTGAYGCYGEKELLGWTAAALVMNEGDDTMRKQIFEKLLAAKSPDGGWGSTQATVLVLRAIILDSMALPTSGKIVVETEDGRQEYEIGHAGNPIVFPVKPGKEARLNFMGTGRVCYSILTKAYRRWGKEESTLLRNGLNLQMSLSKASMPLMEPFVMQFSCINTAKEKTQMTVLSIGLAPGMTPSLDRLNQWNASNKIKRYEIESDKIVLYLDSVPALDKIVFDLPVSCSRPGKYILPPTMLYEYYSPDNIAVAYQETIEIQGKE